MIWLWWSPLVAAGIHIVEEFVFPGGFADWDRSYRPAIRTSITPRLHIIVNAALLLLCAQIGFLGMEAEGQALGAVAWLVVGALFVANAVFHVVGTIRTARRSPGVITAVGIYVPLAVIGYWHFVYSGQVTLGAAAIAACVGGSYHWWSAIVHKFRSRRTKA